MDSFSIVHWVLVLVAAVLVFGIWVIPVVRIIRRAGFSGWWAVLGFLPLANIVGLWCFAFARWPAMEQRPAR